MPKKWPDGTAKSTGNAFTWKGAGSIFTQTGQRPTIQYVISTALRVNADASLGAHGKTIKKQNGKKRIT
ncbi:MAG: hypothetical protein CGW95_04890 [Phenylobacterium zucineum]|nr:MAG: hypothetical protein CGW95_04890 [Phenylobacterium zucineum]